jgi:hypothetical protein
MKLRLVARYMPDADRRYNTDQTGEDTNDFLAGIGKMSK